MRPADVDALPLNTFLALYAQIPRLRRQAIADHALAMLIANSNHPAQRLKELES